MNNYLLSIDPSMKNTGFTLWEKKEYHQRCINDCIKYNIYCKCEISNTQYDWKPIWIKSYNFKKYDEFKFQEKIIRKIVLKMSESHDYYKSDESKQHYWLEDLEIIIERGFPNMKGSETQDHLRGFIAGQFNKLLKKDMLIAPKQWQNWYVKIFWYAKDKKWDKELSIKLANQIIQEQGWNITVNNHDEADSLLLGWYYLNKEK